MKLQAWRATCPNPCDDPLVTISIAPVKKGTNVFPWVLPLAQAEEIFGKDDVAAIGHDPQQVFLTLRSTQEP